jgi:hypothetical protein
MVRADLDDLVGVRGVEVAYQIAGGVEHEIDRGSAT